MKTVIYHDGGYPEVYAYIPYHEIKAFVYSVWLKGCPRNNTWTRRRWIMFKRSDACHYCKVKMSFKHCTIDHKLPKSNGGTNDEGNLVLSCKKCNNVKASQSYEEFLASDWLKRYIAKRKKKNERRS